MEHLCSSDWLCIYYHTHGLVLLSAIGLVCGFDMGLGFVVRNDEVL